MAKLKVKDEGTNNGPQAAPGIAMMFSQSNNISAN
jgi:hypothetical protein